MTQAQVEKTWIRDRMSLVVCKRKNEAVVSFYDGLRTRLSEPES